MFSGQLCRTLLECHRFAFVHCLVVITHDALLYLSVLSVDSHGTIGLLGDLFHYRPSDNVHAYNRNKRYDVRAATKM